MGEKSKGKCLRDYGEARHKLSRVLFFFEGLICFYLPDPVGLRVKSYCPVCVTVWPFGSLLDLTGRQNSNTHVFADPTTIVQSFKLAIILLNGG